jgi:hypothetical protein
MKTQLGWNVADAVEVYRAVNRLQSTDPIEISHMKLLGEKVTRDVLNALLPNLAHLSGVVNASYVSPVGAKSNLMMKPLVLVGSLSSQNRSLDRLFTKRSLQFFDIVFPQQPRPN